MSQIELRNVAIIAHVDHGKTTLVDRLLQQTGLISGAPGTMERVMDSNELERERGITILSKNTAIEYEGYRINVVDTPGHADFGGEVERILSMVDSVLLLVDAVEGPMPQTRFVTSKAFAAGLNPIVVVNKVDRDGAEPYRVIDEVFDLFDNLDATDQQLDFPVVYTSALLGQAGLEPDQLEDDMRPLLDLVVEKVPAPEVDEGGPLQMQISALDYSTYLGVLGVGRINRGVVTRNSPVVVVDREGRERKARVQTILGYQGLERIERDSATAGDIVCVTGVDDISISDTICAPEAPAALPPLSVDEPTLTMMFCVNTSPFAGREGDYLTSRQLKDRLIREASHNVALRVSETDDPDRFEVSGRGELHLSVLIETMRREGYEVAVSRPHVILHEENGVTTEPYELVTADIEEGHQGKVMESLGERRGELENMAAGRAGAGSGCASGSPHAASWATGRISCPSPPARAFSPMPAAGYGPRTEAEVGRRSSGVLVSDRGRQSGGLCTLQPAESRPHDGVAQRCDLRRHGGGHPQSRQRPAGESAQGKEADQRPRGGQRRKRPAHPRRCASGSSRRWSSSTTMSWSR